MRAFVEQVGADGARLAIAESPDGTVVVTVTSAQYGQSEIILDRLAAVAAAAAVMDRLTTLRGRTLP